MTRNTRIPLAREAAVVDALTGVLQNEGMGTEKEVVFGSCTAADLINEVLPTEQVVRRVEDVPMRRPIAEPRKRKAEAEEEEVEEQKVVKRVRRKHPAKLQRYAGNGGFRYYIPPAPDLSDSGEAGRLSPPTMRSYMTPSPDPMSDAKTPYTKHRPSPLLVVPAARYSEPTDVLQRQISPMVSQMAPYPTPSPTVSAFSASPSPAWMPPAQIPEPVPTYPDFDDVPEYNGLAWTQHGYQGQPVSCPRPFPANASIPPSAEWLLSSLWQEEQLAPENQHKQQNHEIATVPVRSAYLCPTSASYPVPLPPSPVSPLAFPTPALCSQSSTVYAGIPPSAEYDANFAWQQQTAPGDGYGATTGYHDIPEMPMDLGRSPVSQPVPLPTFQMADALHDPFQSLVDGLAPQRDVQMDSWVPAASPVGPEVYWGHNHDWV
ncbi:hypothetical protein WG66_008922 [Moniliophthora roreri]|uniref:Uncharacterized protein n=1 Tax=Moniliophthora roreri TaxID=221103 RepID=A0A0W0G684_MONRR|nr:hypothetical protein WG66_008922 [Moniliophthora roreri]